MENTNYRLIDVGSPAYEEMIVLRMKVLLDPIGIPRSYINPQKEAEDLLIGAYQNDKLIGCCILTKVDEQTVQLRQMAVDHSCQGKGIGASILAFAEKVAKQNGYRVLMMHARDTVLSFYQKCGYETYGEPFSEVGVGHHKMRKQLTKEDSDNKKPS